METQGQGIDAKSNRVPVAQKNGDGAGLVSNHESPFLEIEPSGSTATVNDRAKSLSHARRPTGPRTPRGKDRSKHNAVKHGIFSQMVLLKGEPKSRLDSLLRGLQNDLQPEGTLEDILVEKLASLIWRYRRLLIAEGAEIRQGTEFSHFVDLIDACETEPALIPEKKKLQEMSRNIPDAAQLDRLLRYEASLERAFDRTLSQLERLQRMRLGQPVVPPINLNVSSS